LGKIAIMMARHFEMHEGTLKRSLKCRSKYATAAFFVALNEMRANQIILDNVRNRFVCKSIEGQWRNTMD
jgi:hypothetical protein